MGIHLHTRWANMDDRLKFFGENVHTGLGVGEIGIFCFSFAFSYLDLCWGKLGLLESDTIFMIQQL